MQELFILPMSAGNIQFVDCFHILCIHMGCQEREEIHFFKNFLSNSHLILDIEKTRANCLALATAGRVIKQITKIG